MFLFKVSQFRWRLVLTSWIYITIVQTAVQPPQKSLLKQWCDWPKWLFGPVVGYKSCDLKVQVRHWWGKCVSLSFSIAMKIGKINCIISTFKTKLWHLWIFMFCETEVQYFRTSFVFLQRFNPWTPLWPIRLSEQTALPRLRISPQVAHGQNPVMRLHAV